MTLLLLLPGGLGDRCSLLIEDFILLLSGGLGDRCSLLIEVIVIVAPRRAK
jgi:hypothetical protein